MWTRSRSSHKQSMVATSDFPGNRIPPFLSMTGMIAKLKSPRHIFSSSSKFSLCRILRKLFKKSSVCTLIWCIDIDQYIYFASYLRVSLPIQVFHCLLEYFFFNAFPAKISNQPSVYDTKCISFSFSESYLCLSHSERPIYMYPITCRFHWI